MIRGGHIDLAILGAMQVSGTGDIANWTVPGKLVKGMGGRWTWWPAWRDHADGPPEQGRRAQDRARMRLPLTGKGVVGRIITDLGVFDVTKPACAWSKGAGRGRCRARRQPGVPLLR
jgi:3-oxoacid CoA-transferase subunit B